MGNYQMDLTVVVEILKVGLSGLAFLLAFMGYRLLAQEQKKKSPGEKTLRSIQMFLWQAIVLAILVGGASIVTMLIDNKGKIHLTAGIETCRDSLSRLETHQHLPDLTLEDLKTVVSSHIVNCQKTLEEIDEQ